jgi:hypothetical protein
VKLEEAEAGELPYNDCGGDAKLGEIFNFSATLLSRSILLGVGLSL